MTYSERERENRKAVNDFVYLFIVFTPSLGAWLCDVMLRNKYQLFAIYCSRISTRACVEYIQFIVTAASVPVRTCC